MNIQDCTIRIHGEDLLPLPSGGLSWPTRRILCVSDLHLGKSDRIARRGGTLLPPYETRDTLARLEADIVVTAPQTVICLGDSFDDRMAADSLDDDEVMWINRLQAGRRWIWIEGNHDPGPMGLAGTHLAELHEGALHFRHIARNGGVRRDLGSFSPKGGGIRAWATGSAAVFSVRYVARHPTGLWNVYRRIALDRPRTAGLDGARCNGRTSWRSRTHPATSVSLS